MESAGDGPALTDGPPADEEGVGEPDPAPGCVPVGVRPTPSASAATIAATAPAMMASDGLWAIRYLGWA